MSLNRVTTTTTRHSLTDILDYLYGINEEEDLFNRNPYIVIQKEALPDKFCVTIEADPEKEDDDE